MSIEIFASRNGERVRVRMQKGSHRSHVTGFRPTSLEALPVDDGRAGLVVLLLADPHGLEGGQRGEDGAADPDGVLPLRRGDDLDLHGARRHRRDLLLHAVGDTREHGRAAGHDRVGVQVLTDIDVALHDGVERGLVDAARLHTEEGRLEQRLRATETLVANGDDLQHNQATTR